MITLTLTHDEAEILDDALALYIDNANDVRDDEVRVRLQPTIAAAERLLVTLRQLCPQGLPEFWP